MTREEKQLLLKDLCARLPYGVMCSIYRVDDYGVGWRDERLTGYFYDGGLYEFYFGESPISIDSDVFKIRPYLRSMSSMTDEEIKEFTSITENVLVAGKNIYTAILGVDSINWLLEHHFDFMGLIPKGLAIEVTEDNNPYEQNKS